MIADFSDADIAELAMAAGYIRRPADPQLQADPAHSPGAAMDAARALREVQDLRTARLISSGLLERKTSLGLSRNRIADHRTQKLVVDRPTITPLGGRVLAEIGIPSPWG